MTTMNRIWDVGLRDKVAIFAGGSRGLGKAVALTLAAEGCRAALAASSSPSGGAARRTVPQAGEKGDVSALRRVPL